MGVNPLTGAPYGEPWPTPCGLCNTKLEPREVTVTVSKAVARDGFTRTAVSAHKDWWCPRCQRITAIGPG